MKKLFLLIIPCTFLFMQQTGAQPKPTINHIALYVIDLKKSAPFYHWIEINDAKE